MLIFKQLQRLLMLFTLLVIAGCGGDDDGFPTGACGGPDNPCPAYAMALDITPELNTLALNTSDNYSAIVTYSDGTSKDVTQAVTWSTAEQQIATVSQGGIASALGGGQTQVMATFASELQGGEPLTDIATLIVTDAPLTHLSVRPGQAEILVGLTQAYSALASFSDGHQQDVTNDVKWGVMHSAIAGISNEVNSKGVATGLNQGVTQVSASFKQQSALASLVVLDAQPAALIIFPLDQALPRGTSLQYQAYLQLDDGNSIDVTAQSTWQTATPEIASIDSKAFLTGNELGITNVNATLNYADVSLNDSTSVNVIAAQLEDLVVTPTEGVYPKGTMGTYQASAYFSDGQVIDVTRNATWSTSNQAVIIITQTGASAGNALAAEVGEARVTASYDSLTASADAKVTDAVVIELNISPMIKLFQRVSSNPIKPSQASLIIQVKMSPLKLVGQAQSLILPLLMSRELLIR
ncbi:Ig-like domain-containing protein [Shewanella pealeana]|uniref:Ig domain protein group 2 domain protein n=1 Tax=Shewanella pealeana (strain ATCC 700345 / ANG-SQ1) TaxID=398579 RepID=A8H115_SHEPA|nr:Ig-like domain-containing protein [Shewanella pealeana]ABV86252.1 Ig domain protein group 2 domain protein [Shewanella pealeana ATCC 700345]